MNMMNFGYEMGKAVGLGNGLDRVKKSVRTDDRIHGVTGNLHLAPKVAVARFR